MQFSNPPKDDKPKLGMSQGALHSDKNMKHLLSELHMPMPDGHKSAHGDHNTSQLSKVKDRIV